MKTCDNIIMYLEKLPTSKAFIEKPDKSNSKLFSGNISWRSMVATDIFNDNNSCYIIFAHLLYCSDISDSKFVI